MTSPSLTAECHGAVPAVSPRTRLAIGESTAVINHDTDIKTAITPSDLPILGRDPPEREECQASSREEQQRSSAAEAARPRGTGAAARVEDQHQQWRGEGEGEAPVLT